MPTFNIALTPAKEYVKFLAEKCRMFCIEESAAEKEYNRLGFEWEDKIYAQTGIEMQTTARAIMRVYEILSQTIKVLNTRIETLCEYNNTPAPPALRVEPFTVHLQLGNVPPNEQVMVSPDSLQRFENALKRYTDNIVSLLREIRNRHSDMYTFWKDQYYANFSHAVDEFYRQILVQVKKLEFLNMLTAKKRQILLKAE